MSYHGQSLLLDAEARRDDLSPPWPQTPVRAVEGLFGFLLLTSIPLTAISLA